MTTGAAAVTSTVSETAPTLSGYGEDGAVAGLHVISWDAVLKPGAETCTSYSPVGRPASMSSPAALVFSVARGPLARLRSSMSASTMIAPLGR